MHKKLLRAELKCEMLIKYRRLFQNVEKINRKLTEIDEHLAITFPHVGWHGEYAADIVIQE